jgi:hypothetical protein
MLESILKNTRCINVSIQFETCKTSLIEQGNGDDQTYVAKSILIPKVETENQPQCSRSRDPHFCGRDPPRHSARYEKTSFRAQTAV